MGWKLFAFAMAVAWLEGVWDMVADGAFDTVSVMSLPFSAIGTAGLFFYSFSLPVGTEKFWRVFSMVFAAWSLLAVAIMVARGVREGNHSLAIAFFAVVITGVVLYFNWLALRRLSQGA
jgi:hypothetical protein